METLPAER